MPAFKRLRVVKALVEESFVHCGGAARLGNITGVEEKRVGGILGAEEPSGAHDGKAQ